jgi:hypothetical protein
MLDGCVSFRSDDDKKRLITRRIEGPNVENLSEMWKQFLEGNPSESAVQDFLELHPTLLPGLWDHHNGPLHDIVVTKLPLGPDYKTDFAFISRHSMAIQFTFLELEAPSKRIFTQDNAFTQEFNQAKQQVMDWVRWAHDHLADVVDMFSPMFETYDVTNDLKEIRGYLVYGRREEVESNRRRKNRWQSIALSSDKRILVMTYDRLYEHGDKKKDLIVCTYGNRLLYAKSSVISPP